MDKRTYDNIINDDGLSSDEKVSAIFAGLPQETREQKQVREKAEEQSFFEENADQTLTNFWRLLHELDASTKEKLGEDNAEYQSLKAEIEPVQTKVKTYGDNILHPNVQRAIKPLHEIWKEYKGWDYGDNGGIKFRNKQPDREILSSFHRTASFDI